MSIKGTADLQSRTGFKFHVRPAGPEDQAALKAFFAHVSPDDLRFRFLSPIQQVGQAQIDAMTQVDHRQTEDLIAFDPETKLIVANAMLAADKALNTAEVAISIRSDMRGKGIAWTLLEHVAHYAKDAGIKKLQSIESRENHAAIDLEREMGFTASPYPEDPSLVLLEAVL